MGKKFLTAVLGMLLAFSAFGCNGKKNDGGASVIDPVTDPVYNDAIVASRVAEKDGRKYIECNGVPYLFVGLQIRVDYLTRLEKQSHKDLEKYFELARGVNVTSVQVPIAWSDVEPEKDEYTSEIIDTYMGFCNKHDLKLEILWYGSNMCGSTEGGGRCVGVLENGTVYTDMSGHFTQGHVPKYITQDPATYKRYPTPVTEWVFGRHYRLVPDCEATMEREKAALGYLMNAVWEYDRTHGGKRTVVGVQVENEPNMIYSYPDIVQEMTAANVDLDEVKAATIRQLNVMGNAVKNSKYKTYTRVNIAMQGDDYWDFAEKTAATDGIDMVGMDAYGYESYGSLSQVIDRLQSIEGNFANIPEMDGSKLNNDALQLLTYKKGGGYSVFELVATKEFFSEWWKMALYNSDLTKKELTTDRLTAANRIYRDGACVLASAQESDFLAFNLETKSEKSETQQSASAKVTWTTNNGGVAYAVEKDGYILFASTKADTMKFEDVSFASVEYGAYDSAGNWKSAGSESTATEFTLEPCRVYRAKLN